MHRPLVPRNHAKSTETQGNAAKIVFVDLNDWQHRPKPLAPRANAISNAIGYAKFRSRSHCAVICVYDSAGNVIGTHEHAGRFQRVAFPGSKLIGLVRNPAPLAGV